jgi:hypothetical protein
MKTSEVAEKLGIDAKRLRSILRANAKKENEGKAYEFDAKQLPALKKLVEDHTRQEVEAKAAKKAAKK